MSTPEQRRWCLEQAIEIVKHAPADSLQIHDRLKRIYKRLIALGEHANTSEVSKSDKDDKATKKR